MSTAAAPDMIALLRDTLSGDARATGDLLRVLIPVIEASVCQEMLRARRLRIDVEDAVQEVLSHLYEDDWARLRRFDPASGMLSAYVATIARNLAIDILRRPRPPEPVEDIEDGASPDSGPERKVLLAEQIDRLVAALDDGDLLLLRWLWFEGLERVEIAARLGISAAALYKRSQRLEARVRDLLSNEDSANRMHEREQS
jgi:RNA polymerase sigma-70 factor (ECF subfamily)